MKLEAPGRVAHVERTADDGTFHIGMVGADPKRTSISFERGGYVKQQQRLAGAKTELKVILVPEPSR